MRDVGNHRGARSISLALVAGAVAFGAILALGAGAVGIPGIFSIPLTAGATIPSSAEEGGESVVAKAQAPAAEAVSRPQPKAAPVVASASPAGPPRLDNLTHIPLDALDEPESKPAEPDAAPARAEKEELPWDAVEPVPFSPNGPTPSADAAASPDTTASLQTDTPPKAALVALPAAGTVEGWVKAKATEIKGEERMRPLFHFEFWLDAPENVKQRLLAVSYDFNTPAVMPQSQMSSEEKTGFRIRAGGLTCADKVIVTLRFKDGQSQQVAVDGCRLLG
jgi:hypothetical protein